MDEEKEVIDRKFNKRIPPSTLAGYAIGAVGTTTQKAKDSSSEEEDEGAKLKKEEDEEWEKQGMYVFKDKPKEAEEAEEPQAAEEQDMLAAFVRRHRTEDQEKEEGPIPYYGKVYAGMKVRPRGMGTPRGLMVDGEMTRTALLAPQVEGGGGVQWGRYLQTRPHWDLEKAYDLEHGGHDEEVDEEDEGPLQFSAHPKGKRGSADRPKASQERRGSASLERRGSASSSSHPKDSATAAPPQQSKAKARTSSAKSSMSPPMTPSSRV